MSLLNQNVHKYRPFHSQSFPLVVVVADCFLFLITLCLLTFHSHSMKDYTTNNSFLLWLFNRSHTAGPLGHSQPGGPQSGSFNGKVIPLNCTKFECALDGRVKPNHWNDIFYNNANLKNTCMPSGTHIPRTQVGIASRAWLPILRLGKKNQPPSDFQIFFT